MSIEAIIVLVIAMVLLGLGIAFIQGFFKTGTAKLTEPFNAIEFGCDPTAANPITTSPPEMEVKAGDELRVKVCVYGTQLAPGAIVGIKGCTSTTGSTQVPTLLSAPQGIDPHQIGGFNTILTAKTKAVPAVGNTPAVPATNLGTGTYICTLEAVTGGIYPIVPATQTQPASGELFATKQITVSVI